MLLIQTHSLSLKLKIFFIPNNIIVILLIIYVKLINTELYKKHYLIFIY